MDKFPSLERERIDGSSSVERARGAPASKLADPNHNREVIFALPSLQLHLKTEHLQAADIPDLSGKYNFINMIAIFSSLKFSGDKPTVECSFITEFEDHIFVTVDAESFFFLHDLITSYLKEKERMVRYLFSRIAFVLSKIII